MRGAAFVTILDWVGVNPPSPAPHPHLPAYPPAPFSARAARASCGKTAAYFSSPPPRPTLCQSDTNWASAVRRLLGYRCKLVAWYTFSVYGAGPARARLEITVAGAEGHYVCEKQFG